MNTLLDVNRFNDTKWRKYSNTDISIGVVITLQKKGNNTKLEGSFN